MYSNNIANSERIPKMGMVLIVTCDGDRDNTSGFQMHCLRRLKWIHLWLLAACRGWVWLTMDAEMQKLHSNHCKLPGDLHTEIILLQISVAFPGLYPTYIILYPTILSIDSQLQEFYETPFVSVRVRLIGLSQNGEAASVQKMAPSVSQPWEMFMPSLMTLKRQPG